MIEAVFWYLIGTVIMVALIKGLFDWLESETPQRAEENKIPPGSLIEREIKELVERTGKQR